MEWWGYGGRRVILQVNLRTARSREPITMTAPHIVERVFSLGQPPGEASLDLMRQLLAAVFNALVSAVADAVWRRAGPASPDPGEPAL